MFTGSLVHLFLHRSFTEFIIIMRARQAKTIAEYIKGFPKDIRVILQELRRTIREAAPGAMEGISYQIPVFKQNGPLVYFAGYKSHIGFYPTSSGIAAFKKELSAYKLRKGTVQFSLDKPIPRGLVKRIVKFRMKENLSKRSDR